MYFSLHWPRIPVSVLQVGGGRRMSKFYQWGFYSSIFGALVLMCAFGTLLVVHPMAKDLPRTGLQLLTDEVSPASLVGLAIALLLASGLLLLSNYTRLLVLFPRWECSCCLISAADAMAEMYLMLAEENRSRKEACAEGELKCASPDADGKNDPIRNPDPSPKTASSGSENGSEDSRQRRLKQLKIPCDASVHTVTTLIQDQPVQLPTAKPVNASGSDAGSKPSGTPSEDELQAAFDHNLGRGAGSGPFDTVTKIARMPKVHVPRVIHDSPKRQPLNLSIHLRPT